MKLQEGLKVLIFSVIGRKWLKLYMSTEAQKRSMKFITNFGLFSYVAYIAYKLKSYDIFCFEIIHRKVWESFVKVGLVLCKPVKY